MYDKFSQMYRYIYTLYILILIKSINLYMYNRLNIYQHAYIISLYSLYTIKTHIFFLFLFGTDRFYTMSTLEKRQLASQKINLYKQIAKHDNLESNCKIVHVHIELVCKLWFYLPHMLIAIMPDRMLCKLLGKISLIIFINFLTTIS